MSSTFEIGASTLPVDALGVDARATFLTRAYSHLFGAILLFVGIEVALFQMGWAEPMARAMLGTNWLLILGGFLVVGWLARPVAYNARSRLAQYLALAVFVAAEAVIFVPLLYVAEHYAPGVIGSAALVTLAGFVGLTLVVLLTRKDFGFLGSILWWAGIAALLLIVASVIFGFTLGTFFSVGMIAFAGAAILYDTSNILHRYPEDRYVGAALELFASVALLFWYVLSLFLQLRR